MTRKIDYDSFREITQHVLLKDIQTAHVCVNAFIPLSNLDLNCLNQEIKIRSVQPPELVEHIAVASVEFKFETFLNADKACFIHGIFVVSYSCSQEITSSENLELFVEVNSMIHCWPYARECVSSLASRVGLMGITLPIFNPPKSLPEKGKYLAFKAKPEERL